MCIASEHCAVASKHQRIMLLDDEGRQKINAHVTGITFAGASGVRIFNGNLQLLNVTTNLWHDLYIETDADTGVATLRWSDNPGVS